MGWPLGDDAGTVDVSVSAVCARAASTVVPAVRAVNGLSERSGREVLPPDIGHALRELPFIEAEAFRDRLMHVALADRSDAAATPDVVHPLVQLARPRPSRHSHIPVTPKSGVISRTPPISNTTASMIMTRMMSVAPGARSNSERRAPPGRPMLSGSRVITIPGSRTQAEPRIRCQQARHGPG